MLCNGRSNDPEWIALAEQAAKRAGFEAVRYPLVGQAFSLGGEVAPSLQLFFQRVTFTEIAPEAFLGVYVEAFEREWGERLSRTVLPPEFDGDSPPFALHIANVGRLRPRPWVSNSPTEEGVAAVLDWLGRAFEWRPSRPTGWASIRSPPIARTR